MPPFAVGIDLGTTLSAVAYIGETGQTAMVRNADGDILTPSIVYFGEDATIVGAAARGYLADQPKDVAQCAKRDIGKEKLSKPIRGEYLPPEVVQACVLRRLRADALEHLGGDFKAVITVPAFFDEGRRKSTADAGEMAGIDVLDIVNEPTAAALAYGEQLGYLTQTGAPREDMKVLVYDLGGGTFDVTLIDLKPGDLRTLATDGDVMLGGFDWDRRLADYAAGEFESQWGIDPRNDPAGAAVIQLAAEQAKKALSVRMQTKMRIAHAGKEFDLPMTRELFEELTEDLVDRTSYTCRQVLQQAGVGWDEVSRVLLVGGSTRMPMIVRMLEELSGITPDHSVNPDEAVARGAAIYANYLLASQSKTESPTFKVVDVNSHSLGIEGIDQSTGRKENVILVPRNTPLPTRASNRFVTKMQGQKSVVIKVLEGESVDPEHCILIGKAVIRDLPGDLRKGHPIEVSYRYASNGRLGVRARVPGTDREIGMELQREKGLSDERISSWRHVVTAESGFGAFEQELGRANRGMPSSVPVAAPTSASDPAQPGAPSPVAESAVPSAPAGSPRWAGGPKAAPSASPTSTGTVPSARPSEPVKVPGASPNRAGKEAANEPSSETASKNDAPTSPGVTTQRRKKSGSWVNLAGHILAAVVGLGLGFLILWMLDIKLF